MVWYGKGLKRRNLLKCPIIATAVMDYLFQAITAVSGGPSAVEWCTGIVAYWEPLWIPSHLERKCSRMDFIALSFVVLVAWCSDTYIAILCLRQRSRFIYQSVAYWQHIVLGSEKQCLPPSLIPVHYTWVCIPIQPVTLPFTIQNHIHQLLYCFQVNPLF